MLGRARSFRAEEGHADAQYRERDQVADVVDREVDGRDDDERQERREGEAGDVEEVITSAEVDEETFEEFTKTTKRNVPFLFIRGDAVTLVSPPLRG